jgi:hypothetical protein
MNQILDRNWKWQAGVILAFFAIMGFLRFMMVGVNADFGIGFAVGLGIGITIGLLALGWKLGEMRPTARE